MALGSGERTSVKFEASEVYWGNQNCTALDTVAATLLDGKHFLITGTDADALDTDYYVWYDLDAVSADPAIAGRTGIEIDVVTGDTATEVATKTQVIMDAHASFKSAIISDGKVRIQNKFIGAVTATGDGDTTFTFTVELAGKGGNLGGTSGGITLETAVESFQVVLDQTGNIPRDSIQVSVSASISMSLAEFTQERKELIIGSAHGGEHTPSGGTKLVGYGRAKLYTSILDYAGPLILRPIRNKASGDMSEDVILWKTAPELGSLSFSGTDPQLAEVSFTAYLDDTRPDEIDLFAIGDWSQDL